LIYVNARAIIERTDDDSTEIIIQTRNKPNDSGKLELPGGQINQFESLLDALKREVHEETGLEVVEIEGQDTRILTNKENGFHMECIRPYSVYQTLSGPVDSMGVYFKCKTRGIPQNEGDGSIHVKWIEIHELASLVQHQSTLFSEIDLAGIQFYLNDQLK
jgi:8-oxo-dGTP diphosphatase